MSRLSEYMKKQREEEYNEGKSSTSEKKTSSKLSQYMDTKRKSDLTKSIGFDTLESDLNTLSSTIDNVYKEWQTPETMQNTKTSIESMYNRLNKYGEYLNQYDDGGTDISNLVNSYKSVLDDWDEQTKLYGKYKNADEYKKDAEEIKKQVEVSEGMKTVPLGTVRMEITGLEEMLEKALGYESEINGLNNKKATVQSRSRGLSSDGGYSKQIAEKETEYAEYLETIGFKSSDEIKNALGEKKLYFNKAQLVQNNISLSSVGDSNSKNYDKNFEQKSKYVPITDKNKSDEYMEIYEFINSDDKKKTEMIANIEGNADSHLITDGYEHMTDEEISLYNYYYNKFGKDKAKEYLNTIKEDLAGRKAVSNFDRYEDKTIKEWLYGVTAGTDQFVSGLKNVFNTEDNYIPTNSIQQLSGLIREDLSDVGFSVLGNSFGQGVYDLVTTTSNMLPSILTSRVADMILPGAGAYIGAGLMGASASGNAYQEMLNLGYDKGQARTYSALVGVSESILGSAFSGISSLGGKVTGKTLTKLVDAVDNGIAKFAIRFGGNVLSEGFEEAAQEVLTPLFMNIAAGYDTGEKVDWGEVAYSGLLGALSAGFLEGGPQAINTYRETAFNKKTGADLRANNQVAELLNTASMTPEESDAYQLYTQYANRGINSENITDAQLGNLYSKTKSAQTEFSKATVDMAKQRGSIAVQKELLENEDASKFQKYRASRKLDKAISQYTEAQKSMSRNFESAKSLTSIDEKLIQARQKKVLEEAEAKRKKEVEKKVNKLSSGVDISVLKNTDKAVDIKGIKIDNKENPTIITSEGEVSVTDIAFSDKDAKLIIYAQSMKNDAEASLFLEQYDGSADIDEYLNSFNLVVDMGKNKKFTQDTVLKSKGILSTEQVNAIYSATVTEQYRAKQRKRDTLNEKMGNTMSYKGIIKDSVIDYKNTSAKGKVNWKDLKPRQREAITFVKGFAKATGMNLTLITDGLQKGINGSYDRKTNTITLDVHAGINVMKNMLEDTIIPTMSHETTHWMKDKSPELYRKIDELVFKTLEMGDGISEIDRISSELDRMNEKHPEREWTEEDARDEIIARACEDLLKMSKEGKKIFNSLSESEQKTLVDKIKELIQNIADWISQLLSTYDSGSYEANIIRQYKDTLDELSKLWDEMLVSSVKTNQSMEKAGMFEHENKTSNDSDVQLAEREYSPYTKTQYLNFGWVRATGILNSGEYKDFCSKFAQAKKGKTIFNKSKNGEYIIPVSDINDESVYGINNILVFAKGNIDKPKITSIIKIDADDETYVEEIRRIIYDCERRGIQREIEGVFRRYNASSYESKQPRAILESNIRDNDNGIGRRSSEEVDETERKNAIRFSNGVQYSDRNGNVKNAEELSENDFRDLLEKVQYGVLDGNSYVPMRISTPEFFRDVVFEHSKGNITVMDVPLAAQVEHLRQNMEEDEGASYGENRPHDLSIDDVVTISREMGNPAYIVLQQNGRYAMVVSFYNKERKRVVVSIDFANEKRPEKNYKYQQYMNGYNEGFYNIIVTQYQPDDLSNYLNNNEIVYDKKKMNGKYQVGSGRIVTFTHDTPFISNSLSYSNDESNDKIVNNDDEQFSDREYSYKELVAKGDIKGVVISKNQQVKLNADGSIDKNWIVNEVRKNCKVIQAHSQTPTYYVEVSDINKNVELDRKGITHAFIKSSTDNNKKVSNKALLNARVSIKLYEILKNSIEINRSVRDGNIDVPYSHIMLGMVALENEIGQLEYYAVRLVVEERVNQNPILAEANVLGRLHALNAKKVGPPHGRDIKNDVALASSETYMYSIAELLGNVKTEFDDTFSNDVYEKLGVKRKDSDFSQGLQYADREHEKIPYSKKDYQAFGWARANNILNAGQNADYRSKFADAKAGRAKFNKSKKGEYIIPVSDIHDTTFAGIDNVLVFAKGTVSDPIITSVIEIYEYDETNLDRIRRRIYDSERRGIQQKAGKLFERYNASDFEFRPNQQRAGSESIRNSRDNGYGRRDSKTDIEVERTDKIKYSSRDDDVSIYGKMGEMDRVIKENEKLAADVERLRERLKIERQVTHGNYFNENQLSAVAGHLRKISRSYYSKADLIERLRATYSYIAHSEQLSWEDVFSQCYDIAESMIGESRPQKTINYEYKDILKDIRNSRISLDAMQKQEARYGFDKYWNRKLFGKITIANDGVPLDIKWQEWASKYPHLFKEDISSSGQVPELIKIIDNLKDASEIVEDYYTEEETRWLATEIYNQYWNVSPIRTTADKYEKRIRILNFEHRRMIGELLDAFNSRIDILREVDIAERKKLVEKIRERKEAEVKAAKEHGRERLAKYKEEAERKTRIQSITANALNLNEYLVKNSKDKHIPEIMKGPVINLLNAIDFSSKRLLDKGVPTNKDISLSKALGKVKDMMVNASNAHEELVELYGHNLDDDIEQMVDHVDDIMRNIGDNEFVLNKMTLADLQTLDKMVKTIKHAVNRLNKFHTVSHAKGIANLSQESMAYLDSLGKGKIYDGLRGSAKKLLDWGNALPHYVFKRFGSGGMKVYEALQDGWDKFAFNVKKIIDYANEAYTSKEVNEWGEEVKTFKILVPASEFDLANEDYVPQYQKVQLTVPQIMSLYCLNKREQARGHLFEGGIRVADFKNKKGEIISQSEGIIFTEKDISTILDSLTERQKAVADKLQKFMNTVCTEWGNEVSMARFGYKAFGEENYFPIQSDENNLNVDDETKKNNSLFRLLNMSFTKGLVNKANNRIVISDIFDVFAQHTSDMAKYNALALPVLDSFKWYNYTEKQDIADGTFKTIGVKQSIERAFGKDGQNYFTTFLKDINGQQEVSRDTLGKGFFTRTKIAAVGANLRVVLLQPTSYARASAVIDNKYLVKALGHKPKIEHAEKYCGIALWKSIGYYDTNIQKGVEAQIKHNETWKDKAVKSSMKGAEISDKLTWGYLWNACELEVRDKRKDLKVGSEEFYEAIAKRLREVIYATQVVDSTMTRSQMMRSSDGRDKLLTAFASEPTLAYNMLQDAYMEYALDARRIGKKEAIKKNGKRIGRIVVAYTMTNALAALVESGFDAFRDDEDEEMDIAAFMKLYFKNFALDMSIGNKIPYVKEIYSMIQGYSSSRTDTQWMGEVTKAITTWYKIFNGKGNTTTAIKYSVKTMSDLTGLPLYNAYRDTMAVLNKLDLFDEKDFNEMFDEIFD